MSSPRKRLLVHARPHVAGIDDDGGDTPVSRSSVASVRVSSSSAALLAPYGPQPAYAPVRGVARDVHDEAAAFGQERHRQLDQRDRRAGVDGEDTPEALHVELHQRSDAAKLRCVVDEQVQSAELARRVDQPGSRPPRP